MRLGILLILILNISCYNPPTDSEFTFPVEVQGVWNVIYIEGDQEFGFYITEKNYFEYYKTDQYCYIASHPYLITEIKKGWYHVDGKNVIRNKVKFDLQNNSLVSLSTEDHLFLYSLEQRQVLFSDEGWLGAIFLDDFDDEIFTFDVKYLGDNQSFFMPLCD